MPCRALPDFVSILVVLSIGHGIETILGTKVEEITFFRPEDIATCVFVHLDWIFVPRALAGDIKTHSSVCPSVCPSVCLSQKL